MSFWCRLDARTLGPAHLEPPRSKSDAQRALALAYALGHRNFSRITGNDPRPVAADVLTAARGLHTLANAPSEGQTIDCHDGGAPFRFLVSQAAVTPSAEVRFIGTQRLGERPHRPLLNALREALGPSGLRLEEGGPWPVTVRAPARFGAARFRISGEESSQFVSSLVLGAATLVRREARSWTVEVTGPTASLGYLEMTLQWLRRCGFRVDASPHRIRVESWAEAGPFPTVPGDWSSLGYLVVVAWATGGSVGLADLSAVHPDKAVIRILSEAGVAAVESPTGGLKFDGQFHRGVQASGLECPDLLPTLAALACVLPRPSTLEGVEILVHKESDRLRGIQELCAAVGGRAELADVGRLVIHPTAKAPASFVARSHGDHRQAMSAAVLAILTRAVLFLEDPGCVEKSFPTFFEELEKVGARCEQVSGPPDSIARSASSSKAN